MYCVLVGYKVYYNNLLVCFLETIYLSVAWNPRHRLYKEENYIKHLYTIPCLLCCKVWFWNESGYISWQHKWEMCILQYYKHMMILAWQYMSTWNRFPHILPDTQSYTYNNISWPCIISQPKVTNIKMLWHYTWINQF